MDFFFLCVCVVVVVEKVKENGFIQAKNAHVVK